MSEPHVVSDGSNRPSPIDRHLEALLLQQRGDNAPLVREVLACLSPAARERLFRVLRDLESEVSSEKRMRKQGRCW